MVVPLHHLLQGPSCSTASVPPPHRLRGPPPRPSPLPLPRPPPSPQQAQAEAAAAVEKLRPLRLLIRIISPEAPAPGGACASSRGRPGLVSSVARASPPVGRKGVPEGLQGRGAGRGGRAGDVRRGKK